MHCNAFGNRVCEVLSGSPYIDSERCVCISDAVEQRIEALKSYVNQNQLKQCANLHNSIERVK